MLEQDPNKTGRNRDSLRERLNQHSPVRVKYLTAAKKEEDLDIFVESFALSLANFEAQ